MRPMSYKVVEISPVTDEEIEKILNHWTCRGYSFLSIHFVTTEASRRPSMAFLFFIQDEEGASASNAESGGGR